MVNVTVSLVFCSSVGGDGDFVCPPGLVVELRCGPDSQLADVLVQDVERLPVGAAQRVGEFVVVVVGRLDRGDDHVAAGVLGHLPGVGVVRELRRLLRGDPQDLIPPTPRRSGEIQGIVGTDHRSPQSVVTVTEVVEFLRNDVAHEGPVFGELEDA